jgi:hypothetical protein
MKHRDKWVKDYGGKAIYEIVTYPSDPRFNETASWKETYPDPKCATNLMGVRLSITKPHPEVVAGPEIETSIS